PLLALDVPEVAPQREPAITTETAPATPEPKETVKPPKPFTHVVEEGETVRMLAAKFSLDPATILSANNLRDPDLITVGQELIILPTDGVLHTLRAGESIRRVAQRYGVETSEINKANDLGDNPDMVQPGTDLVVPGATPVLPGQRAVASGDDSDQEAASVGGGASLPLSNQRAVPSTRTYEGQPGDTLVSIAETFGVDVATILSSNGIDDPDTIKPGSELRILPVKGLEYTVDEGETLADIAWRYQVDLGLLLDYNDLNDPDVIHIGQKLVVPGGKLRPEAVPVPAPPAVVTGAAPAVAQAMLCMLRLTGALTMLLSTSARTSGAGNAKISCRTSICSVWICSCPTYLTGPMQKNGAFALRGPTGPVARRNQPMPAAKACG